MATDQSFTQPPLHTFGGEKRDVSAYPLDEKWYPLRVGTPEFEFWSTQTGIHDEEKLKEHILKVQSEAYPLFPYGSIRFFFFLRFIIREIRGYDQLLKLAKERKDAILLDVGCCFGTDIRVAATNGWPSVNIVATDIQADFWELGHKLICSTHQTFPAKFVPGDIFNPAHLDIAPVLYTASGTPRPTLTSLTSLNPLRGHVSAIHAGAFFHLFTEEQQAHIAHALASLLSPKPGSMIVGTQSGAREKGIRVVLRVPESSSVSQFCHSPESFTALWDGQVFKKGTVKVDVELIKLEAEMVKQTDYHTLSWSVTRL